MANKANPKGGSYSALRRPESASEGAASARMCQALLANPAVAECAVLRHDSEPGVGEWVVYVVPAGPFDPESLASHLPASEAATSWVPVAALPRTAEGVIDVEALQRQEVLDKVVLERWREQLGARSDVDEVAVVVTAESPPPAPRLHTADLIPGRPVRGTSGASQAQEEEEASLQIQTTTDTTRQAISDGGPAPVEGLPATLPKLLKRAAEQAPERGILYLLEDGSEQFQSYPDLLQDAECLLAGLRRRGLAPGDSLLLQLAQRQDFLTAVWACLLGGFVPVPATVAAPYDPTSSTVSRLCNAWQLLDRPLVLSDRDLAPGVSRLAELPEMQGFEVAVLDDLSQPEPTGEPWHAAQPDDLALLLMTSGSTGKPKLVAHTHRGLLIRQASAASEVGLTAEEISLNWLTLDHVASLVDFHLRDVFLTCAQVQVPTEKVLEDPLRWLDWIDRYRATVTWAPHFAYALLAERVPLAQDRSWDLSCLRCSINGGEAIVARTARLCLQALADYGFAPDAMHPVWGMAETASGVTYSHFTLEDSANDDPFVEVGPPMPGFSIRIVDDQQQLLNEGEIGRMQIKGPVVTPGYYRRPEVNREVFTHDGWFNTGDLAFLKEGRLTLTGRESDVLVIHGLNHYSHEIESAVDEIAGVQPSYTAACGVRDAESATDQLAIFFHTPLRGAPLQALIEEIRQQVLQRTGLYPDYVMPMSREDIPKTAIGKIQRSQLKLRFESGAFDAVIKDVDLLTGSAETLPNWFFHRVLKRQEIDVLITQTVASRFLVFLDPYGLGLEVIAKLDSLGLEAIAVETGTCFAPQDGVLTVAPDDPESYRQLLAHLTEDGKPIDGILHLASYGPENGADEEDAAKTDAGDRLLALLQAVDGMYGEERPLHLWWVSSHSQASSDDASSPQRAALLGIALAARRELPWLRCRHLDLEIESAATNADRLIAELSAVTDEAEVLYRGEHRWVPRLSAVDFEAENPRSLPFESGGVYLLTGGLGGIGLVIARHLLERYQARLLLIGRSPSPSRLETLQELEGLGGEVAYASADVTDADRFLSGARGALERWQGQLDGVIHLAGVFHQASVLEETSAGLESALRPKLAGSEAMERLIEGTDAFFLAFSSISSAFGGATLAAYAAANRAQESFCHQLRLRHSAPVYCFSWSLWHDLGLSHGLGQAELLRTQGYHALSPEQGLDSLLAALASGQPDVLVGLDPANRQIARQLAESPTYPLQRLTAYATSQDGDAGPPAQEIRDRFGRSTHCDLRRIDELPRTPDGNIDLGRLAELGTDGSSGADDALPESEVEKQLAALFEEFLGVARVRLSDNFFQLGGHSILATQLLARLEASLGVAVPTVQFLSGPTVAQLAEVVEGQLATQPDHGTQHASAPTDVLLDLPAATQIVPAPQDRYQPFPITEIQQAYWIGESAALELGDVSMHLYQEIDGVGLDPKRLSQAWQQLVERHDMLRAVLLPDGTEQVLEQVPAYRIEADDLQGQTETEVEAALSATRHRMSHQRFAPDHWPSFEIRASLLPEDRIRLHFSTSLLNLDGGSFYLLMSEWGALTQDPQATLPTLQLTYRDYALALAAERETESYGRALAYWQERLPELPPAPALPLRQSLATLRGYRFVNRRQEIPAAVWRRVEDLAHKMSLSRSAILLAAYGAVLDAWSAGDRLTVNATLFNRPPLHPQIYDVVGDFTSTLLVAIEPDAEDTFETLARRVQERLWSDLEHRQVSGVTVVRELARLQDEPSAALMPYVFTSALDLNMRGATSPGSALADLGTNAYHLSQTPQVLLDFLTFEESGALVCIWDAVQEAFPDGLIDDMFDALGRLIADLAHEEAWKARPQLIPAQQLELRATVNATEAPVSEARLHTLFTEQAMQRPDHPAVITPDRALSYRQVEEQSQAVAAWLNPRGARRNALVAVMMEKGWEQVVGVLGVLKAGAAYVPIDPGLPRERRFVLLDNGDVDLVLTQKHLASSLEWPDDVQLLSVDEVEPEAEADATLELVEPEPTDLAYVIFTSGSTGLPKGVMIDHRGAVNTILDIQRRFTVGPQDRVLALSALSFDLSVYDVFGTLAAGGTIVMPAPDATRDPEHWSTLLHQHKVTIWNSVPALMEMLVELTEGRGEALPTSLRLVLMSGDWIPVGLPQRIRTLSPAPSEDAVEGIKVVSLGGATEASIWSILYPIDAVDPAWTSIPYGRPMDNQRFHVLDGALEACPTWVPGDLYIGGIGVALGYWRDADKTAASFIVHPRTGERLYRTGDLGRYLPDGDIEFLGRQDNQVKIRGHRIELGEIEATLEAHPALSSAVVLAVGESRTELRLVACAVPSGEEAPETSELRRFLEDKLPSYMVPAAFLSLESLPLSATGKVDRGALSRQATALSTELAEHPQVGFVAPRNPLEEKLAAIWAELLNVERIGVHDDIFQLGGNSLMAIMAISRLRESLQIEMPLRSLLGGHPTVAGLARTAAQLKDRGTAPPSAFPKVVPAPEDRALPFPLHAIQQAYWIGRRGDFELGNVAAYFYLEVEVPELDLERLDQAWQRVIERHAMLRVVFLDDGRQQVLEEVPPYRIEALDLRGRPAEDVEAELAAIRERMSRQVMPADRWPLFEFRASFLNRGRIRLHFGMDLLIADAWSVQILFHDLERFYQAPEEPQAPLALSYRDYLLTEQSLQDSELWQRSREYWWSRLGDLPPAPRLPLAKDLSAIDRPDFVRRRATLEPEAWQRLQERASQRGLTPSGVLMAAFSEVLAVWSRQPSFILNVTTFNRLPMHGSVEEVVGDFTSLTLLAVDGRAADSFEGRAQQLQEQLWQDLEHRHVSGIEVLRELAVRQGRAPGALAPIVFTSLLSRYQDGGDDASFLPLQGDLVYATSQTPQVWLDHQVLELGGGLAFTWDVVEELLPEGLLDDMFGAYVALLERLADDDEADSLAGWQAQHLELLPPEQRAERHFYNHTEAPPSGELLHTLFATQVAARGDGPAVIANGHSLTYRDLARHSRAVATWLRRHGARPDTLVAVVMEKGWEQVVGVLGIVQAGAAYLPIDPALPARRREFLLNNGRVELVVSQRRWLEELEWPSGLQRLSVDDLNTEDFGTDGRDSQDDLPEMTLSPEHLAYVIFTSGSTGQPKGVMIDHGGAVNTIDDINRRFMVGPQDRALALSALSFDLSVYDVFGLLAAGGGIVLPPASATRDPGTWLELMRREGVTIWNSVPALMEMLVEYATLRSESLPESLRLVLLSGDWIPVGLPDRLRALAPNARVISLGGATEASIWSIFHPIAEVEASWVSIPYGRPLANQRFYVLDDGLEPCPTWVPGELYIGGRGLAKGYWRDEERSEARFPTHPRTGERLYRTGDLGRFLPSGEIEFLGREDLQVKIRGHRIELGEIEAVLGEHPEVMTAVVVVAGESANTRRLHGFYVPTSDAAVDVEELQQLAVDRLPSYMVPAAFDALDTLPLSTNGKVDRGALVRRASAAAGEATTGEGTEGGNGAPSSPLQAQLAELWCELLEAREIRVDASLFDLGGNSLLAIRMLARVQEELGVEVSLRRLFENPSVVGLAQEIEAAGGTGAPAPGEELPTLVPDPEQLHEPFPLNDIQQAYWLGRSESLELGNVAAHFYFELELETQQPERIQQSWQRLVERHDMLRAVFLPDGRQRILDQVPTLDVPIHDLRGLSASEAEADLETTRQRLSHQVLATDRWPLFEIVVSRLSDERVRVHFSFDLLIADAWSARQLFSEFADLYKDPQLDFESLDLSFRDYILAIQKLPETGVYQRAQHYWSSRLPELPPAPELPLVKDPASLDAPRFQRRSGRLPADLWQRLKQRASKCDLTPSGLLLAVYTEVLARWSQNPRFTVNVTTFNRLSIHERINDVVGDFTSLTLLAVDASAADTFEQRASRVQQQLWEDLDHRTYSGVQVLRDLARQQGRAPGALMPVVFTSRLFHGAEAGDSFLATTGGEVVHSISQTPQVWLDKQVDDDEGDLIWTWDAVEDLFPAGLLDDMFAAYGQLLEALAQEDDSWQRFGFELRPESQIDRRSEVNATAAEVSEATLHGLFASAAAERPDQPAVITPERQLSYRQLAEEAGRVAAWLRSRGARPNNLVAIVMDKGWEQAVAAFGILQAGAAYLPIDPAWPRDRRAYLLANGQADVVITQRRWHDELEWPKDVERLVIDRETLGELPDASVEAQASPSDLAYVIFTSGSTGEPKGVAIEHRGAVNTVLDVNQRFDVNAGDRVFALSALTFDLSVYDLFGTLAAGATLVMPQPTGRPDPAHWVELLNRHSVTLWNSVPALLELFLEHVESRPETAPESLRLALLSGDWLPLNIAERLRAQVPSARVISLGGATEASIWSILYPVDEVDPRWASIPYGQPMVNQEFHVLDSELQPRPEWVPGDLYIGGVGLARGYWRDEEKSAGSFITHPETGQRLYRTGDLGRPLPDGNIEFLGRSDFQVKIQGYRIELGEIEVALNRHPDIATSVVTAPSARGAGRGRERRLVAYVVPREASAAEDAGETATQRSLDIPELRRFLGESLPEYMVPASFVELAELPLTANGKVDRGQLEQLGLPQDVGEDASEDGAPRTPVEAQLCDLITELLDIPRAGIHDNFFDLGGDSLLAIQLINRLRDVFHAEISLQELFRDPSVAHLATVLAQVRASDAGLEPEALPTLVPDLAARHEPFPLNEVQQAYWVGRMDGLELGNVAAHSYTEVENSNFDLEAFSRGLQRMIARHDTLRLIILPDGQQQILEQVPEYEIEVLDLRGRPEAEVEAQLEALRRHLSHQVLATDRWPIFEIRATLLDGGRTRLHLSFDLLISDAWSSQILFRELAQVAADPQLELPALDISFRDYLMAEASLKHTDLYRRSLQYWQQRLPDLPPAPELPLLTDTGPQQTPQFIRRTDRLPSELWQRLQELGTQVGLTPSGLLLAAFCEVLTHASKNPRFTLNLTTFSRLPLHPQVNDLMGDFTSLTLLSVDNSGSDSFTIRARRLQEQLWADLDHRYVNGITVMRELARLQGRSGDALMPVVFTSRLFRDGRFGDVADLQYGEVVYSVSQTPQVWLDHQVVDEEDGLAWTWDTVDDLFPDGLIEEMFRAYSSLLRRLAQEPESWQQGVQSFLLPAAQRQRQETVNTTGADLSDELLHTLCLRQAEERAEQPAVISESRALSYAELSQASHRLGRWLRERGAKPGTLVAVVMEKGWEQVAAVLGVLHSGAAYLPIDPELPAERLAYLLEQGQVELALTQSWLDERLAWPEDPQVERLSIDLAAFDPALDDAPLPATQGPDDLAYVIFTSGSTGRPKGVAIDHRGAVNTVLDINQRFEVEPQDRVLALSALNFDLSVYDIFGTLAAGGTVVVPKAGSDRDPAHWSELIERHRVTIWNSVPTLMEMLAEYHGANGNEGADAKAETAGNGNLSHAHGNGGASGNGSGSGNGNGHLPSCLRLVLMSGDWIPVTLPTRIHQQLPDAQVISLGGATEASIWSILYPISGVDPTWKSIPYGRPMVNQTFHVLDDGLVPRQDWVPGELYIGGVGLARGYWRDEEKTSAAFFEHPNGERLYRTGDYGRYLPDGNIEFLGREDQQVKVQGYRIELGEVEAALQEHPAIARAVVTAPPIAGSGGAGRGGRRLVGYVISGQAQETSESPTIDGAMPAEPTAALAPITEPVARLQFKLERRGLRPDLDSHPAVSLPAPEIDSDLMRVWAERRSHRQFLDRSLPLADFGRFLSCLRQIQPRALPLPKVRYPSAGGLYPVQVYVAVKAGAIDGLDAGLYYYHPRAHELTRLADAEIDRMTHGSVNRPIFDQAGFSLLLIGKLSAIGPLYPDTARDFCLLEAGYMGQLLMTEASSMGVGLCPLGGIAFGAIRDHLDLAAEDELVHTFVGGPIAPEPAEPLDTLRQEQESSTVPAVESEEADASENASEISPEASRDTPAEVVDWSQREVTDPVARLEFKLNQLGLRTLPADLSTVALPAPEIDADLEQAYASRRSCRTYLSEEIALEELGHWLSCLRSIQPTGVALPKYRYPSGGGLYPVQTYLHVKANRVEGLAGGTYFYDPAEHRLRLLRQGAELDRGLHGPVNQPIFDQSAFSIFLIAQMNAIAPLYPDLAGDFCQLEAGYMGQLLMSEGPAQRIGLAPLGGLDFEAIRHLFELDGQHRLIHLFEGGRIAPGPVSLEDAVADQPQMSAPPTPTPTPAPSSTSASSADNAPSAPVIASPPTADVSAEALKDFLAEKLPAYMVPPHLILLDRLPLTANGKVDRKALPLPEAAEQAPAAPQVAPRSNAERQLADLVRELLQIEQVGIYDNFFELGATSVQIIQLQRSIHQQLGHELPITDIFRHPNVLALAESLAQSDEGAMVEAGQEQARRRKAASRRRRRRRRPNQGESR